MKDIKDLKFMSLGGNCADIGYLGPQRIHGPVDNMFANKGLSSVKQLIENELFSDFNTNIGIKNPKTGWTDFQSYSLVHNRKDEKFIRELKSRVNIFNGFLKDIQNNNHYFVYTLNCQDVQNGQLTKEFLDGFNWLSKQSFFNKIIFVSTPVDEGFRSCFCYSYDFSEFKNIKTISIQNMAANKEDDKRCYRDFIRKLPKIL